MRHHPASLPFFSACINGANRNYQTLHYSLKPSYGNCHLTTLQQAKEMTSGSIKGFAGSSMCKASLTAVSLLRARPCDTPLSHCVVAVLQDAGWKHTHPSVPRRPTAKSFSERGHIITQTGSCCCPCTLSARAPSALSDPQQRAIKSFWSIL